MEKAVQDDEEHGNGCSIESMTKRLNVAGPVATRYVVANNPTTSDRATRTRTAVTNSRVRHATKFLVVRDVRVPSNQELGGRYHPVASNYYFKDKIKKKESSSSQRTCTADSEK